MNPAVTSIVGTGAHDPAHVHVVLSVDTGTATVLSSRRPVQASWLMREARHQPDLTN